MQNMHLELMKYSGLACTGNFIFVWGMISFYWLAFPLYILVIRNRTLKKTLMCVKQILLPNKIISLCLLFSVSSGNGKKKLRCEVYTRTDYRKMQYWDEHFSWYFEFTMIYKGVTILPPAFCCDRIYDSCTFPEINSRTKFLKEWKRQMIDWIVAIKAICEWLQALIRHTKENLPKRWKIKK